MGKIHDEDTLARIFKGNFISITADAKALHIRLSSTDLASIKTMQVYFNIPDSAISLEGDYYGNVLLHIYGNKL